MGTEQLNDKQSRNFIIFSDMKGRIILRVFPKNNNEPYLTSSEIPKRAKLMNPSNYMNE
jgi:hypothetical protein